MAEITPDRSLETTSQSPGWRARHASTIRLARLYVRTFARNGSAMLGLFIVAAFLVIA